MSAFGQFAPNEAITRGRGAVGLVHIVIPPLA